MGELVVVRGTVIGDAGKPVAGWVSLGKKQPQRFLSRTVRIESNEGHEMTLEQIDGDEIQPVSSRDVKWQDLEGTEIGNLCAREAPAPDVEIDLREALIRGGDKVSAWGEVIDRGYIGGESQRGSVEGGITKIRVILLHVGEDAETELEKRKEAKLAKQRKEKEDYEAHRRKIRSGDLVEAKKPEDRGPTRRFDNYPLLLAIGLLVVAGVGSLIVPDQLGRLLRVAAVAAWAPLAFDAVLIPPFRTGPRGPNYNAVFGFFVVCALVAAFLQLALAFGPPPDPDKLVGAIVLTILLTSLAAVATGVLWFVGRKRSRYLRILASAPEHPEPFKDGVWGRSVGRFSAEVLTVGNQYTTQGSGKNATVFTSGFANCEVQGKLLRDGKDTVHVQLGDSLILPLASIETDAGAKTIRRMHYINSTTPAIAAGRGTDGVLRRGGEASLIVFASPPRTDVLGELARLRRRLQVGAMFALVGALCFVGSFFA